MVCGDLIEMSPPYDIIGATTIVGPHIATELCYLVPCNKRNYL